MRVGSRPPLPTVPRPPPFLLFSIGRKKVITKRVACCSSFHIEGQATRRATCTCQRNASSTLPLPPTGIASRLCSCPRPSTLLPNRQHRQRLARIKSLALYSTWGSSFCRQHGHLDNNKTISDLPPQIIFLQGLLGSSQNFVPLLNDLSSRPSLAGRSLFALDLQQPRQSRS